MVEKIMEIKAELRIKSISEESVTIRYDGFTIIDKGNDVIIW